jgi:hypothetical protein
MNMLNQNQIDYLLRSKMIGRIGCAADDKVYVVPITYIYDGTYILGHSMEGMKIRMMRANPRVCFQVEDIVSPVNWRSAIVWGEYEEIREVKEVRQIQELFRDRLSPYQISEAGKPPDSFEKSPRVVEKPLMPIFFKIKITEKTGRFEK